MTQDPKSELRHIELSKIKENPVALRSVNRESEKYVGLVDSIRKDGVLNPILVREIIDPDTKEVIYGLIDGLHRFTASQDAGHVTIPAQVRSMSDARVLEAQVLANVHKVETRPVEYSQQLMRILVQNPLMTTSELAATLSRSPSWLSERLGLTKLHPDIATLTDDNKIVLANAYALAKLPLEEQPNFLERSMTMQPPEFVPTVNNRIKELRDAKRQGRDAKPNEFVPVAHARKIGELKAELEKPTVGPVLIRELKIADPLAAFQLGVQWALHVDPASVEAAKTKDEQRKKEERDNTERRKKERLEKQQKEAQDKAEALKQQLEGAKV